jgi:hypothetical protein
MVSNFSDELFVKDVNDIPLDELVTLCNNTIKKQWISFAPKLQDHHNKRTELLV